LTAGGGFHNDEREYHFGLRRHDGRPKLLHRLWAEGGPEAALDAARLGSPGTSTATGTVVAGGGTDGVAVARELLSQGRRVRLVDDLASRNTRTAVADLRVAHGPNLEVAFGLGTGNGDLARALEGADAVVHVSADGGSGPSLAAVVGEILAASDPPALLCVATAAAGCWT
jgi:CDP-paratose 2-epimerase